MIRSGVGSLVRERGRGRSVDVVGGHSGRKYKFCSVENFWVVSRVVLWGSRKNDNWGVSSVVERWIPDPTVGGSTPSLLNLFAYTIQHRRGW